MPPIWLMRQAGRYQARYQQLRARHSFEDLCRIPELAAEVALGPVLDFDFDAAILFSDLLFPLEALGFGLSYDDGSAEAGWIADVRAHQRRSGRSRTRCRGWSFSERPWRRRARGCRAAPGSIGFVGGPWTLFVYAVEGTHAGALERAKSAKALYRAFADRVMPLLQENIRLQFEGGADVVMVFDTAAGELAPDVFARDIATDLDVLARTFPQRLGYYAKGLQPAHLAACGWDTRVAVGRVSASTGTGIWRARSPRATARVRAGKLRSRAPARARARSRAGRQASSSRRCSG